MLDGANFQGALLRRADLQGTNLRGAKLQGANLRETNLQGADLDSADLQGAGLQGANFQGALFWEARLQSAGADLRGAKLQGADLQGARLQGAELANAGVWLAKFDPDREPKFDPDLEPSARGGAALEMSPLTDHDKYLLREWLKAEVTDAKLLTRLLEILNPILRTDPETWKHKDYWSRIKQTHDPAPDEKTVKFLARMACDNRYIADAMAHRAILNADPDYARPLAKALLSETCEGAKALTDRKRTLLEQVSSAHE
jgi:hypothetical protein